MRPGLVNPVEVLLMTVMSWQTFEAGSGQTCGGSNTERANLLRPGLERPVEALVMSGQPVSGRVWLNLLRI